MIKDLKDLLFVANNATKQEDKREYLQFRDCEKDALHAVKWYCNTAGDGFPDSYAPMNGLFQYLNFCSLLKLPTKIPKAIPEQHHRVLRNLIEMYHRAVEVQKEGWEAYKASLQK